MSERSRAKLHSSPVPGDHSSISNQLGRLGARFASDQRRMTVDVVTKLLERFVDVRQRRGRAQERDRHSHVPDRAVREALHSAAPSAEPSSPAAG